jgi:hypothetical protein
MESRGCTYVAHHQGHLAAAAVNRLIVQARGGLFTTAPKLLTMIRDGFDAGQAENLIGLCQRVPWIAPAPMPDTPYHTLASC